MAGAGYKLFVSGDVLTAAQVNTYLNEQTVMVFATSAARTSALSLVLAEGMMSYLQDSNTVFYYDGAAWNALASGDITAITAGNGISVTSGTGPVPTVEINTAVTVDKTTAQTLTNKTLTTPIISSISNTGTLTLPTSTDTLVGRATTDTLTNKTLTSPALTTPTISTLTTNGDLLYGTGSGALSRLGIGSSAQILTVASGIPSWATPAASASGLTLIVKSSFSAITSHSLNNCFSATYDCYKVIVTFTASTGTGIEISYKLRSSGTDNSADYAGTHLYAYGTSVGAQANGALGTDEFFAGSSGAATAQYTSIVSDINTPFKTQPTTFLSRSSYGTALVFNNNNVGYHNNGNSFDGLTLIGSSGTLTGTIYVYGMAI